MTNQINVDWVVPPRSGLRARYVSSDRKKLQIPEIDEVQPGDWMPLTAHRTAGVNLPFRLRLRFHEPVVAIVCVFRDHTNEHHPYLLSAPGCFEGVGCFLVDPQVGQIIKFDGLELLAFNVQRAALLLERREAFLRALAQLFDELGLRGIEALFNQYRFPATPKVEPRMRIGIRFIPLNGNAYPIFSLSEPVTFRLNDRKRDLMQSEPEVGELIFATDERFSEVRYAPSLQEFGQVVRAARNQLPRSPSARHTAFSNLTIGDTVIRAFPVNSLVVHYLSTDSSELESSSTSANNSNSRVRTMPLHSRLVDSSARHNKSWKAGESSQSVSIADSNLERYESESLEKECNEPEVQRADGEATDCLTLNGLSMECSEIVQERNDQFESLQSTCPNSDWLFDLNNNFCDFDDDDFKKSTVHEAGSISCTLANSPFELF